MQKKELLRVLSTVRPGADPKSAIPILSHVLLRASRGELVASATDLIVVLTDRCACAESFALAVPIKDLIARAKAMPGPEVALAVEGLPADDFPTLPTPPDTATTIELGAVGTLAKRAGYAMSEDAIRSHVHAALLEVASGRVTVTATDGHRLAQASAPCGIGYVEALLPFGAVHALARIKGPVTLTRVPSHAWFASGTVTISCRITEAKFPPYAQVIPKSSERVVRGDIRAALASVEPNDVTKVNHVWRGGGVELRVRPGAMTIASTKGSAEAVVDYDGAEFRVGVNHRYLTQALVDGCEIRFGDDELDPIRIDAPDYLAVVMPMRI